MKVGASEHRIENGMSALTLIRIHRLVSEINSKI